MSYGKWIANLTRRVETIEKDRAAEQAVGVWKKWAIGVAFTVANLAIMLLNLYLMHH